MSDFVSCLDCDHSEECVPMNGAFPCPYPIFAEAEND